LGSFCKRPYLNLALHGENVKFDEKGPDRRKASTQRKAGLLNKTIIWGASGSACQLNVNKREMFWLSGIFAEIKQLKIEQTAKDVITLLPGKCPCGGLWEECCV
jgi:hypothetical protein